MPINAVTLAGNLTRDPEIRETRSQTAVMNFSIAVNERARNQQTGEWESRPNYFDCVLFGKRANGLVPYLHKGLKVCVTGRLRQNVWERDGKRNSRVEVVVEEIEFMSPRDGSGGYQADPRPAQAYAQPAPVPSYPQPAQPYQSDIPF